MNFSHKGKFLPAIVLIFVTLLAYQDAILNGGFVWDDDDYVTENPLLEAEDGLERIWFEPKASPQYYPLVFTTFRIERALAGEAAWLHHLVNVLLHAASGILIFFIGRRVNVLAAWFTALLFLLHPVHTESVAWITERKNVLSGCLYLASLALYLRATRTGQRFGSNYLGSLFAFSLALFSKTVVCTLGPVILLWRWWQLGRIPKRDWLAMLPFFVLGGLGALMTASTEVDHVGAQGAEWDWTFGERFLMAGRSLFFYVGKLLLPLNLSFNYAPWEVDTGSLFAWLLPLSVLAMMVLLVLPRITRKIGRGPGAALLFFAGTLFPALGFFNIYPMRYYFVADHYQYLASLGVLAVIGFGFSRLPKPALLWVPLIVLIFWASLTYRRCEIYRGHEALWRDTLAKNENSWLALNNLAMMKHFAGKPLEARQLMARALAAAGQKHEVLNNAGQLAAELDGDDDAAIAYFRAALTVQPVFLEARSNLALMLTRRGEHEEALAACDQTIADARAQGKEYPQARFVRARALFNLGRYDEALRDVEAVRVYLGALPDLMQLREEILAAQKD